MACRLRHTAGAAMQARPIETRPEDGAGADEVQGRGASPILSALREIHDRYRRDDGGRVATYIPELAKADRELFGIALATSDGMTYEVGDSRRTFTIQSISKPFVYGLALEDRGREQVLGKVGVEPSGNAFNMFKAAPATRVVFRRRYRGTSARSKRRRTRQEQAILDAKTAGIAVYELQGALYFASMEEVLRQITGEIASISHLILDMTRVLQIDDCAAALIGEIRGMLQAQSKVLVLAHLRPEIGDPLLGPTAAADPSPAAFSDSDAALEWCENRILLESLPDGGSEIPVPLASMDAVAGLDDGDLTRLKAIMREASYAAGAAIIREGDAADALFLLAEGRVSVWLSPAERRRKRLATVTPGVAFGDLALFGGGPRSADVVADAPSVCYVLPVERLDVLSRSHPEVRTRLMANLAREMAARLRSADAEIRTLEE